VPWEALRVDHSQGMFFFLSQICFPTTFLGSFQAVVSVLLSNFSFELPDGTDTKIEISGVRAKVDGEEGLRIPLIVKKVE